jgi:hypothetical protein
VGESTFGLNGHDNQPRKQMTQSPSIGALAAALSKAQGSLKIAAKDANNPFFKSKYADLASVWEACRAALTANGLSVAQLTDGDTVETMVMHTTLMHSSGEWVSGKYPIKPTKNDPQGIGAAITYARRYSLAAMVGIVSDEDDDAETAVGRAKIDSNGHEQQRKPKWTDDQKEEAGKIRQELIELGADKLAIALWNKCAYDPPSDVIDKLTNLLAQQRDIANQAKG